MRKRITTILPLYLACIILLAFVVFPHHHHTDYICFNVSHCGTQQAEPTQQHSHEHDPFTGDEGCMKSLFQTEIERSLSLNHHDTCQAHCHHFTISLFTLAGLVDCLLFETTADDFPDSRDEMLPSVFYATDLSGRAPPVF